MNNKMNLNSQATIIQRIIQWLDRYPIINYWFPVIVIAGFIFYASRQPEVPAPPFPIPHYDKILHIIVYAILGLFSRRAFAQSNNKILSQYPGLAAIIFCIFYGISDEYHQSFIETRVPSIGDLLANAIGGFLGQYYFASKYYKSFAERFYAKR